MTDAFWKLSQHQCSPSNPDNLSFSQSNASNRDALSKSFRDLSRFLTNQPMMDVRHPAVAILRYSTVGFQSPDFAVDCQTNPKQQQCDRIQQ
jgi:hypothetical protein